MDQLKLDSKAKILFIVLLEQYYITINTIRTILHVGHVFWFSLSTPCQIVESPPSFFRACWYVSRCDQLLNQLCRTVLQLRDEHWNDSGERV